MKPSIRQRLDGLLERHEELSRLLASPEVAGDGERFRRFSTELAGLDDVATLYAAYRRVEVALNDTQVMLDGDDEDLRALAREELPELRGQQEALEERLQFALLPKDVLDDASVFLEIRAAAGGDEAALFAGDLLRMYMRYAELHRWQFELLSQSDGEHGGFRQVIARIGGSGVYARLKFESGTHRVQRVPATEAQGRIHTSTCTVAILPEPPEEVAVEIRREDLKVDTFRSSGAGGQHVNTTDSAIRITHIPSGIVVECQDERSQHKNRARAMSLLAAHLQEAQRSARTRDTAARRRLQVGTGDRSERVRTYNYPQGRVTDHRIELTLYRLDDVLGGGLDLLVDPLVAEDRAEQLAALAGESA